MWLVTYRDVPRLQYFCLFLSMLTCFVSSRAYNMYFDLSGGRYLYERLRILLCLLSLVVETVASF